VKEEDLTELIGRHPQARAVFLKGFECGRKEGYADAQLEDHAIAELAARIAIAQVENQADIKTTIRHAAQFIDVNLSREKRRIANESRPDSRSFKWDPAESTQ
jgi:hypothetical protein